MSEDFKAMPNNELSVIAVRNLGILLGGQAQRLTPDQVAFLSGPVMELAFRLTPELRGS